jgi:hypothetical protein
MHEADGITIGFFVCIHQSFKPFPCLFFHTFAASKILLVT